jgi:DNA-binding MurR/RpiR family transcriptional regulator
MDSAQVPISLDERIAAIHASLSNKQKRLARFVLDNKYFISFAPASQAGKKTGASAATVVRFAQALGYKGYSDMQAAIQAELPSYVTAVERIQMRMESLVPPKDVAQNAFYADIRNIERTANNLSAEMLYEAIEVLVQANCILVVGAGLSAAPALFLAHSLRIIGLDARVHLSEGLSLAADVSLCHSEDVLIAIDLWRYVRSTTNAVVSAKKSGVQVITITDSSVSPLSVMADYAFEVAADGVSHSLSCAAAMSLLNVLIAALSFRIPEQALHSLRQVDSAYRENELLIKG